MLKLLVILFIMKMYAVIISLKYSKIHWAKNCHYKRAHTANIEETSDEEETKNKYEMVDVHFVLVTIQNLKKKFVKKLEQVE